MGQGLAFDIRRVSSDVVIALPPNNHSLIYLVTTGRSDVTLTLPPVASAVGRFVTVQRADNGRKAIIKSQNGEPIDGAKPPLKMDDKYDALTLVTDGVEWVVLYRRQ